MGRIQCGACTELGVYSVRSVQCGVCIVSLWGIEVEPSPGQHLCVLNRYRMDPKCY